MADTIELHYRCSDEEFDRLVRRQDGRDGERGELPGQRLGRALAKLCDDVEQGGWSIAEGGKAPAHKQRKARVPRPTIERMKAIVAGLPGVSQQQFMREAIRRWTRSY